MAPLSSSQKQEINAQLHATLQDFFETTLKPQLTGYQQEITAMKVAYESLAKSVERLSILVVGDSQMRIKGLASRMDGIEDFKTKTLIEHAKLAGIWGAIAVVAVPMSILLARMILKVDISGIFPR